MGRANRQPQQLRQKNLVLISIGIAMIWMPLQNAFYRYTIVGEGPGYTIVLAAVTLACIVFIALRKKLANWLSKHPPGVMIISSLTLITNGVMLLLPYLPLSAEVEQLLHLIFVLCFELAFVFLFFVWIRRLSDMMFQVSIVRAVGCVGLSIAVVGLLANVLYGTVVYTILAYTCLFFSGLCWQLCTFESVDDQKFLRILPTARSLRRWSLLLAAFLVVSLLQAVMYAAFGSLADKSEYSAWILNISLVMLIAMFAGTIYASSVKGMKIRLVFSIIIILMTAYYMGILSMMAAPQALSDEGCLAVMAVVQRTLRIFIFLALIVICYQDSAAPSSTFGLFLLLVEVIHDLICYVAGPAFFNVFPYEASSMTIVFSSITAIALMLCFAGFILLRLQEWHEFFNGKRAYTKIESANGPDPLDGDAAEEAPKSGASRREVCEMLGKKYNLTEREIDVLYYLSLGFAAKKIADTLYVSPNTISTHSSRLYRKMGVHNRQDLIDLTDKYLEDPATT